MVMLGGLFVFFFFSSRRRHTRSDRDWSSDVCSSDLGLNGKLLGAPYEKLMYGDWDKSGYGLRVLPLEVRHGLIFGSGAEDPMPFEEYLGDYAWYLDVMFADTEWEPLGPRDHYVFKGNWKMRA